ncbi:hypothetical protein DWB61_09935 [Ancylomarina euxinus]|uniref:Uncharacterized protein n=1 Tax=Ancylomarina euxinus TaxID=2283627 RepID=A0A425Y182_9BACT|nr:hypothetical protein [Ancylomarina euxinus]MCZ4693753.1 hypothetical protein [Ancylomarina euxinus]MUP15167.1 hypothetical protein [Ancylomarina euxinus]RRG21589.1 hypothetical protein DWB61_09935 [Ancylomarina euxinus]
MKIYSNVNFKDKVERKAFIYSLLIMVVVSQVVALIIWYFFDENHFVGLLIALVAGFLFGYRGLKKKTRRKNLRK